MWMEKLAAGVLRVQTQIGPRYIAPSFRERIFLLWMFRHFDTLPQIILSPWQRRFVDRLCMDHHFISMPHRNFTDAPLIGTLERLPVTGHDAPPSSADVEAGSASVVASARQRG